MYPTRTVKVCENVPGVANPLDRLAAEPEIPANTVANTRGLVASHA